MPETILNEMSSGRKAIQKRKPKEIPTIMEQLLGHRNNGGQHRVEYPFVPTRAKKEKGDKKYRIKDTSKQALEWANTPTEKVVWYD